MTAYGSLPQKNQSALASLRGTVYENKIMDLIKQKAKSNKKEISKDEAEKILKQSQKQDLDLSNEDKKEKKPIKNVEAKKTTTKKAKSKTIIKKSKKVSKK